MDFSALLTLTAGTGSAELASTGIRFRSPYADYHDRADIEHLFGLIDEVLTNIGGVERLEGDGVAVSVFGADIDGTAVDGVLRVKLDAAGAVGDVLLSLRPFAGVKRALAAMETRLADRPLPSSAG